MDKIKIKSRVKKARNIPGSTKSSEDDEVNPAELQLFNKILLNYCNKQIKEGVESDKVMEFLYNPKLVREFFKNLGFSRPAQVTENPPNKKLNVLRKLFKMICSAFLFLITSIIFHIGICHLMDINPLMFFPSLQETRCLIPSNQIIMEMARPLSNCGYCSSKDGIIEMQDIPSESEFFKVAYLSIPIIIRGGVRKLGMVENMSIKTIKEIYSSEPGGIQAVVAECEFFPFNSPFNDLVEALEGITNFTWTGKEQPWYFGWSNGHAGASSKLMKLYPKPNFLPSTIDTAVLDWIFIGSPGPGAPKHVDYVKRASWQAQVMGTKKWTVSPVLECDSVCPKNFTFTINTGDIVFVDTNLWFHETFVEGDKLSMSVGWEYD